MNIRQIDITKEDVRCSDELMLTNNSIEATYELWFEVDKYFGTNIHEDDNAWINFYTYWYPDGTITAKYSIDNLPNGYESYDWKLTDKEIEFFRNKMEDYCQKCDEMSLMELWAEYNDVEVD